MHPKYQLPRLATLITITIAVATLLPPSATAQNTLPTKTTQSAPVDPANTKQVIQLFSNLKAPDLPTWLRSSLSSTTRQQSNDDDFARATWLSQLHIVQDQAACARLHHQATPILKLFGRQDTVRFFIYLDKHPNLQTIAGSYLGVSTGLMELLKHDTPDSVQLNGLVAHELARAIQQETFIAAWRNEDFQTIRAFELFYDAVATAALTHLHLATQQYALILQRMIRHNTGNNTDRQRHPDLKQRQTVIRTITLAQSSNTHVVLAELD